MWRVYLMMTNGTCHSLNKVLPRRFLGLVYDKKKFNAIGYAYWESGQIQHHSRVRSTLWFTIGSVLTEGIFYLYRSTQVLLHKLLVKRYHKFASVTTSPVKWEKSINKAIVINDSLECYQLRWDLPCLRNLWGMTFLSITIFFLRPLL